MSLRLLLEEYAIVGGASILGIFGGSAGLMFGLASGLAAAQKCYGDKISGLTTIHVKKIK